MASIIFYGAWGSLGAILVSTNGRPIYSSIRCRFSKRRQEQKLCRILHEAVGGTPRRVYSVEIFEQKIEDLTFPCSTSCRIWRKIYILN